MRVFVTGAAGFLGLHLLDELLEKNHSVTALASPRATTESARNVNGVEWVTGDARDLETLLTAVRGHEAVIHLAGRYPLFGKQPDPMSYVESNTATTAALLEACRRLGVSRFVFPSTAQVYGKPDRVPIAESDPLNGATVYAASKIGAEALVRCYAAEFAVNAVSLRVFNAYGPGHPPTTAVATIVNQAVGTSPVSIYTGAPERDFVYAGDVARALVAAIHCDGLQGQAMNIASGTGIRIGTLARQAMDLCGRSDEVVVRVPQHVGSALNPDSVIADVTLAEQLLGWRPTTSLEEGLLRTIEWTRKAGASIS